jgi:hypothetical protein
MSPFALIAVLSGAVAAEPSDPIEAVEAVEAIDGPAVAPVDATPAGDVATPPAAPLLDAQALRDAHNARRARQQVEAMSALMVWSGGNIAVGAGGWALADDPEWRSFHQMSVAWGGINLAIAIPGLIGALREDTAGLSLSTTLRRSSSLKTSFALNAGLDVGWVALGGWLAERGLRTGEPTQTGFGRSMMMQGGFLLVFDAVLLGLRGADDKRLMLSPTIDPATGTFGVQGAF